MTLCTTKNDINHQHIVSSFFQKQKVVFSYLQNTFRDKQTEDKFIALTSRGVRREILPSYCKDM
jgi:hypothetical protein